MPPPATTPGIELTLPQVRQVAVQALQAGRPELAYTLAQGLLKADPTSSFAYFTRANAQALLGQPRAARKSAAKSYRYANTTLNRFEAAELAARLSYAEQRPTLTQLWLRRAVQHAPNKEIEARLGRDYGTVRAQNPVSFSLRGGLRPSNNVNNGSDTTVQIIDGLPFTGTLSGSALALSGTVATMDASLGYRLQGNATSRTTIGGRLFVKRVALDSNAQALAPSVRNSDLGTTYGEASLRHDFLLGQTGNQAYITGAFGQFWFGGERSYDFARLEAGRDWALSKATKFRLDAAAEQRQSARDAPFDSTSLAFVAGVSQARGNGDSMSFALNLRHTESDFVNARTRSATLSTSYSFGQQMGPVKVSAGLVAGYSDYPDYVVVFAVPGGRQDKSIYANLNLFFPDVDYAGFAPTLRIAAGRKFSNVSRFDTREVSVSFGIQSKF
ncbi:hypothetical protein [Sulfitobacter aestuariivivens]|uniref:tetratricopeptide repeat protein n=1 Tax=Sulfitobacter aestuariivivens TaxID=2766981 RepID=UPI0031B60EBB